MKHTYFQNQIPGKIKAILSRFFICQKITLNFLAIKKHFLQTMQVFIFLCTSIQYINRPIFYSYSKARFFQFFTNS